MMNKKVFLVLFILMIAVGAVSSVSANESNEDLASDSVDVIELNDNNGEINTYASNISSSKDVSLKALKMENEGGDFQELQEIIDDAEEGSSITLSSDYYCDDDFRESNTGIIINKTLTINGNGHLIDALEKTGIFLIYADGVTINDLSLINGHTSESGAAAYVKSNIASFNHCNFSNNYADSNGGAIYSTGKVKINACYFYNNYADSNGGAIYAHYPSSGDECLDITDSEFNGNRAESNGGAIYLDSYTSEGLFANCSAKTYIENTVFESSQSKFGGAIFNLQYLDILDCRFIENNANPGGGGAIYMINGAYLEDETETLIQTFGLEVGGNSSFIRNYATRYGGAIKILANPTYLEKGIMATLKVSGNVLFEENQAETGGALDVINSSVTVENATFRNNTADENGSAMNGGTAIKCIFEGNSDPATYNTEIINGIKGKLVLKQSGSHYKDKTLTITLTNADNGKDIIDAKIAVKFSNGKTVTLITDDDGEASYNIPYIPGTYNATATVLDELIETDPVTLANIKIAKAPITISPSKLSTTYASGKYFQVKVTNSKTKNPVSGAKLKLKAYTGKKYKTVTVTTNSKGIAKYSASTLSIGTHKIIVSNGQTAYFTGTSKTSSAKVSKASYTIVAPVTTKVYKQTGTFKITVKNKASGKALSGVKLTVKVYTGKKYKTYSLKTNAKGIASLSTKTLTKANHKVVISTKATGKYKAGKKSSTIKIIKTKISTVLKDEGTPMSSMFPEYTDHFKNVFNSAGSCIGYDATITLRDSNGKELHKPISVYSSKYGLLTNGTSGQTFFISKTGIDTLTFKFAGDSLYKASSCTKEINLSLA